MQPEPDGPLGAFRALVIPANEARMMAMEAVVFPGATSPSLD
jgi:hypothetical protein